MKNLLKNRIVVGLLCIITALLICFGLTPMENGKAKIIGHYEKVNGPSESLCKRLRGNGMPLSLQQRLLSA